MLSFLFSVMLGVGGGAAVQAATTAGQDAKPGAGALSTHPFGVRKGMSTAELEKLLAGTLVPADEGLSVFEGAPVPHPDFKLYLYMHSPRTGLCGVGAISVPVGRDTPKAAGAQLLQKFDALKGELQAAFGEPTTVVRPQQLEIADLQAAKADLRATWILEAPGQPAPDVASITLWALPKPPVAMLRIIFRFSNASLAFRAGQSNSCQ